MSNITIKVKSGIKYISDVPEIKEVYNNDFPPNSVIDKQVTGVGGTHLALTNDSPYIVAIHLVRIITGKLEQDKYKHVFPVTGSTTSEEIEAYLASGGIKFLCTYDSVPRLQNILGVKRAKEFKLLVDEVHCLIGYLDRFKPAVAVKLIEGVKGFRSVSYLTATPTNPKYLPKPLQKLTQVKFEWEEARKPDIQHHFSSRSLTEDVLSTAVDLLDNSSDEVYLFYNSRRYVVSLIKKLLKLKEDLKLEDINILFSETDDNTRYFIKQLGSKSTYGSFP